VIGAVILFCALAYLVITAIQKWKQINPNDEKKPLTDHGTRRKAVKDALSDWRVEIQFQHARLYAMRQTYYQYHDAKKKEFDDLITEAEKKIISYLREKVGKSEAASFGDNLGIPKIQSIPVYNFQDRWADFYFMLNRLEYRIKQLETIENKLDSKDFILPLDNS
jgi:hypothetical protein